MTDAYLFALLIHTIYNPQHSLPNLTSAPTQATAGAIPRPLFPIFKRMLNPNPRTRLSTTTFIPELEQIGFWQGNNLVELVDSLEAFELASEGEKAALLRRIKESVATLPPPFLISKILPSLLHSLSLPSAPSSAILPLILAIGRDVPEEKYRELVLDPVVRLYASPDRGTRMALLDGLVEYGERLDKSMVNDRVWPHLVSRTCSQACRRINAEFMDDVDYRICRYCRGDTRSNGQSDSHHCAKGICVSPHHPDDPDCSACSSLIAFSTMISSVS